MTDPVVLTINAGSLADSINAVWALTISFLIFFMQPGFLMLEAGQVRSKNVANVAMKNMFDWSLGVLAFFVVGLGLSGLIGSVTSGGGLAVAESFSYIDNPGEWIGWLTAAVFAMTAATIVSGAVVGRIKFKSYVVYSVMLTMVIYPVVLGLTWQGGLLAEGGYLGELLGTGYLDFAGGTVVHMVGGIAGLTAAYVIGPRNDRYEEDGTSNPIPGHSVLFTVLGTLFLAFGWFGFNVGTQATVLAEDGTFFGPELGRVALVTTLGMGAGGVASSLVTVYYQGKPDPIFTANGLLAGLVAVTGGAAYVTWWGGLLLGVIGGALVYPTYRWTVDSLGIDDVCGVFAVHGAAGGVGVILIPLVGVGAGGGWSFLGVDQLLMQFAGVAVIGTWTVLATIGIFLALGSVFGLRSDEESQLEGLDQVEHNIVAYPQFVTDGGVEADTGSSSQGSQEASQPTMWRGEEVGGGETGGGVLRGDGIDQFPDPTLVVDGDDEITALNPRAAQFFQTVEEEAVGSRPASLVDDDEAATSATTEVLETGQELRDQVGSVTVRGETTPVRVTATPLWDGEELTGVMAVFRDNTAEVASENQRRTVEEYQQEAIERQREKLGALADGDLDVPSGVPEPPAETDRLQSLHETFTEIDDQMIEVATNVSAIVEKLPGQSEELASSSDTLSDASDEVSEAVGDIDDLSSEIEEGLADLATKTRSANQDVGDLSATIEEVSASAAEIESQSGEAVELTRDGVSEMDEAVERIRSATAHSNAVTDEIDDLEDRMDEVAEIVDIIQNIAEQTNMLALNASIEAANASGDGEGFAVVAEEVKSLAEQTKESADDIAGLIEGAQSQTSEVARTIREANEEVEGGADAVEGAVSTLEDVQDRVEETNNSIEEISAAVSRQAENTESVSATMQEVTGMTDDIDDLAGRISNRTDSQATEMATVSELATRLNEIATDVHDNISRFDLAADLQASPTPR